MTSLPPSHPARLLAERLQRAEPPELAPEAQRDLARRAWREALQRRDVPLQLSRPRRRRRRLYSAALGALALSVAGLWLWGASRLPAPAVVSAPAARIENQAQHVAAPAFVPAPAPAPLHVMPPQAMPPRVLVLQAEDLEPNDKVTYLEGTALQVNGDSRRRTCRVRDGAVLFEIDPARRRRLEVDLPGVHVVVTGTIFTVWTKDDASQVRVYEGSVQVTTENVSRTLEAGDVFESENGVRESAEASLTTLHERAERAAQTRAPARDVMSSPSPIPAARKSNTHREHPGPPRTVSLPPESPDPKSAAPLPEQQPYGLARAKLARGDYSEALTLAAAQLEHSPNDARWLLLRGDALRAQGQLAAAADSYTRAATASAGAARAQAGYLAARLWIDELGRPEAGLRALDEFQADTGTSALAERALTLRVEALDQLGRPRAARQAAVNYLERFPAGPSAERMRARKD